MKSHFLRRFIAGLVVFIPLAVLVFGLIELHEIISKLTEPLLGFVSPDTAAGAIILKLVALLLVVLFVYLLGYLADLPVIRHRVERLDRALHSIIPGYVVAKGIIGGVVKDETLMGGFRPVLVQTTDGRRAGFEVERTDSGLVVVFLPNSPAARSGTNMVFEAKQVEILNVPPHKVAEIMNFHGRGLGVEIDRTISETGEP